MENVYKNMLSARLLKLLEEYAPDFFYIVDYAGGHYLYVSDSITACTGHHPKQFCRTDGLAFTLSLIHPDDLQATLDIYTRCEQSEFVGKIPSATIEYRLKHTKGHYIWVRSRDYVIEFTEDGKVKISLGMVLRIDKARNKEKSMLTSKHIDIEEQVKEAYSTYDKRKKALEKLSFREFQIIELLSKGLSSKAIASELEISEDTVETHRKNILKKLSLNNTVQTINLATKYKRIR